MAGLRGDQVPDFSISGEKEYTITELVAGYGEGAEGSRLVGYGDVVPAQGPHSKVAVTGYDSTQLAEGGGGCTVTVGPHY